MERVVTLIYLPEAPNPKVGPPTLHQPRTAPTYTIVSFDPFRLGGGGSVIVLAPKFFWTQTFLDQIFFGPKIRFDTNFLHPKFLGTRNFWTQFFFGTKIYFGTKFVLGSKLFLDTKLFWPNIFGPKLSFRPKFYRPNFFRPKFFLDLKFF